MSAIIRNGTLEDVPESVELGGAFHREADLDFFCPVDLPSFDRFIRKIIEGEVYNGIYLVAELNSHIVGLCIGLIVPVYFNENYLISNEMVFYVEQGCRDINIGKALLEAFEKQSALKGANKTLVGAKSNMRVEAMGKMYERKGYRELERYFVRSI